MMVMTGWKFRCLMICFLWVSVDGEEEEGECLQAMNSLIKFQSNSMNDNYWLHMKILIGLYKVTVENINTLTNEVKENYKEFQKKIDALNQPDTQEVDPPLESASLELIPMPTDSPHTISFKSGDESTYKHWVSSLNNFIEAYEGGQYNEDVIRYCNFDQYEREKNNGNPQDSRACKFSDTWLGGNCYKGEHWGFNKPSPCIILKLNTTLNWEPDVYKSLNDLPAEMPLTLKDHITEMTQSSNGKLPPMVWLSCTPDTVNEDLKINFGPFTGFPAYYFPRNKINGYLAPLVGVGLTNPERNVVYNIECHAWTKNIIHETGQGLLQFQFRLD